MDAAKARAILDVPFGATTAQIESAYRTHAKAWHPDRYAHDPEMQRRASEQLRRINLAFEVLKVVRPDAHDGGSHSGQETYYRDECRYCGHDPRLPPARGLLWLDRRAVAEVAAGGLRVVTTGNTGRSEQTTYPLATIRHLWALGSTQAEPAAAGLPADQWNGPATHDNEVEPPRMDAKLICIEADDPEGILTNPIEVWLKFESQYRAQLFVKRAASFMGLTAALAPEPSDATIARPDDLTGLLFWILLIGVLPLILLALAGLYHGW